MSLITEDGTIVAGAESYCSVVAADSYHLKFANASWTLLDTPTKEAMLRRATAYMLQVYRLRWKGVRMSALQVLDWPRAGVCLDDVTFSRYQYFLPPTVVPAEVINACASLALIANTEDLAPALEREVISEKVGPIETTYRPGSAEYKRYRAIDLMLKIYLGATGSGIVRS
ncbi:DnaT-like ssDNA-binding protein [Undibacterium sp. TJN19]|uniref:DnaT-like ssDNA-binding protein n=1 Tax=Undibacterium sp. TJN19 TaxID=3413055 RepID=UPI003BF15F56